MTTDRDVEQPDPPHSGHPTGRLTVAGGTHGQRGFVELGVRPAQHELSDPVKGYLEGAQIQFFNLSARYFPGENRLRLHEAKVLDILSASPRSALFSPISWSLSTGARMRPFGRDFKAHEDAPVGYLEGGAGFAWELGPAGLLYLMAGPELLLSRRFGGENTFGAVGLGAFSGWAFNPSQWWRVILQGRATGFVVGEPHPEMSATLGQSFTISRNWSLLLEADRSVASQRYATELRAALNFYY